MGKRREYFNNGKLAFEGEYLNGKKNGNIKEYYYDGKLAFEGEYLNGEINGKGKNYFKNGLLSFEGEYLNGKKWNGKYTEYIRIQKNNTKKKTYTFQNGKKLK